MSNRNQYHAFCTQVPQLPLFVQPWYLDMVSFDGTWDAIVAEYKGKPAAAMPYFLKKKGPFQYISMPYFCKHLGPYFHPDYSTPKFQQKFCQQLIEQLPKTHAFTQEFHPSFTNWLAFYWKDYHQTTRYTYRLDLSQGLDAVWQGFSPTLRNEIKYAQKQAKLERQDDPATLFSLFEHRFKEKNVPQPISRTWFLEFDGLLASKKARAIFLIKNQRQEAIAGLYLTWDQQYAYLILSGFSKANNIKGANAWVTWESIKFAAEKGLNYDFEGSMLPGVEHFYRQFGGVQTPYFKIWKYHSKLFQVLESAKRHIPIPIL